MLSVMLSAITTGCRKPQAASSAMSVAERESLVDALRTLDETLASKSPFIFDKLRPGANDEEIDALRAELGGAKIDCVEAWYRWHDGCDGRVTDVVPLGRMLSIAEALEDRELMQGIPFVDAKRKSALKILDDGAGDGFFLDIASSNPRVFYHMLEDPYPRDYGTLEEFVTFLNEVHAAGIASENEHGMVSFDSDRYQKIESDYLARIGAR
jgi:hypothetical protein